MADERPEEPGESNPEDHPVPREDRSADDGPGPRERPALRRSAGDRVLAGVAGGIGTYFGIDPVIVRIGFIVLTFMGGAGPFLYLVGWLALPREMSGSIVTDVLAGDSPRRFRSILAVVLIGLGLLITASLSGELFDLFVNVWSIAPHLALLLIAAGAALVLWPGPTAGSKSTPARSSAPGAFTSPAPPPPAATGPEWRASSAAAAVPVSGAPSESSAKKGSRRGPRSTRRRPRSTLGPITVSVLLIFVGGAILLGRLDVLDMEIAVFLVIASAITGVGLVVSAFAGRARGLIPLGVALAAPLVLFAGTDALWGSGTGERRVRVTDADTLEAEYRHGIGRLVVDLRDLEPDGTARSLDVSVGVGEVLVYVPDNIRVVGNADVVAGAIREYYHGPARYSRTRDLLKIRDTLGYLLSVEYEGEDSFDDVEDYLEALRDFHGGRMPGGQENPIVHLLPDLLGDRVGEAGPRDLMNDLLIEARNIDYPFPVDDEDSGLSLARTLTAFVDGEPQAELHIDIDVAVGRAEVVTVRAHTEPEATSP